MKLYRQIKSQIAQELSFLLACPAIIWQVFFLFLPLTILLLHSVIEFSPVTNSYTFTLKYYSLLLNTTYFKILINSIIIATSTTLICFLIAYPLAYYLALKVQKRFRPFLLFSLILPSWTSLIIQVYAWFFLLEKNGIITQFFKYIGLLSESAHLLNNYFAVLIGMVCVYLPFMTLPLYTVLEKVDPTVLEASADLGASRLETFKRVIFPLSLPGVYVGFLLVFLPALGEFAIPALLGGNKMAFWGTVIVNKLLVSREWASGAAFATLGVLFTCLLIASIHIISKIITFIKKRPQEVPRKQHDIW
ncbi:MAG: ABC transporter permease [bacterium]